MQELLPLEIERLTSIMHGRRPCFEEVARENEPIRELLLIAYEALHPRSRLPTALGRFRLLEMICTSSGQANIAKAIDDRSGKEIVVKFAKEPEHERLVREEARLLKTLNASPHPAIPRYIDSGQSNGVEFVAMELFKGSRPLKELNKPRLRHFIAVSIDIADALRHCHTLRIWHLDLSLRNILVTREWRGKLIDFAMSCESASYPVDGERIIPVGGTRRFVAPERLQDDEAIDGQRTEVYSLAAVLYEWLTGQNVEAPEEKASGDAIGKIAFDFNLLARKSRGAPKLVDAFQKALAIDAGDRPPSMDAFIELLCDAQRQAYDAEAPTSSRAHALRGQGFLAGAAVMLSLAMIGNQVNPLALPWRGARQSGPSLDETIVALTTASANTLRELGDAGLSPETTALALQGQRPGGGGTVAEAFFSQSKHSKPLQDWFRLVLRRGVDPNMTVNTGDNSRVSLLHLALRAASAETVVDLLEAGAHPHPFATVLGSELDPQKFLFPYYYTSIGRFSNAEMRRICRAMHKYGAVAPKLPSAVPSPFSPPADSSEACAAATQELLRERFDISSATPPTLWKDPQATVALRQSENSPLDWVAFARDMPKVLIAANTDEVHAHETYDDIITTAGIYHFLTINGDRAYFLGVCGFDNYSQQYAIFETHYAATQWTIYAYGRRFYNSYGQDMIRREVSKPWEVRCWRGVDLTYDPESKEMRSGSMRYNVYRNVNDMPPKPSPHVG